MTPENVIDIFRQAVFLTLTMVVILVLPGLIVGLIVSILQAATQINEMSLSFIPKLLVTFFALAITGPWLLNLLINYTQNLFMEIPYLVG